MAPLAVDELGDDILREILLRLPSPAALVRAALASRSFLLAARDAGFLRRFRARHPPAPLLRGFLFAVPRRTLNSFADFFLPFLPGGAAKWDLIDSRGGILLLRHRNAAATKLAVADPSRQVGYPVDAPTSDLPLAYGLADAGNDDSSAAFRWSASLVAAASIAPLCARWLDDGRRMVAFDASPAAAKTTAKLSILDLPPFPRGQTFNVIDTDNDDGDGLRLLTMRDFRLEVWKLAAAVAGDGGRTTTTWTLEDTSVRFYKAMEIRRRQPLPRSDEVEIAGVFDGFVFLRLSRTLFSIDLKTMKLRGGSDKNCSLATIYPYTKTRAWPPSFLNPNKDCSPATIYPYTWPQSFDDDVQDEDDVPGDEYYLLADEDFVPADEDFIPVHADYMSDYDWL
uniref:F-box protein AT5G49610-like beta-propeller domain-containing protein n=1 Tax=Leersia perrieri TaxID=77586 RepID=A0A0D9WCS4_9ORYZ